MAPAWEQLADHVESAQSSLKQRMVTIAEVDCDENDFCEKRLGIEGYPVLRYACSLAWSAI